MEVNPKSASIEDRGSIRERSCCHPEAHAFRAEGPMHFAATSTLGKPHPVFHFLLPGIHLRGISALRHDNFGIYQQDIEPFIPPITILIPQRFLNRIAIPFLN